MTLARPDFPRTPLKRRVEISTSALSDSLTQVSVPGQVLGFIRAEWNGYSALRGSHLVSAQLIGCYSTRGMALEALRQRPRSI